MKKFIEQLMSIGDIRGEALTIRELPVFTEQYRELFVDLTPSEVAEWNMSRGEKGRNPRLESFIYILNARKVARFKKGYDSLPKNDRIET